MGEWNVECVELPYPKPNQSYQDGWEHVEFVIPSQAMDMDELRADFVKFFPEIDIEALKEKGVYSEEVPHAEGDQLPNPSITLCKSKMLSMKFHAHTIAQVVLNTL